MGASLHVFLVALGGFSMLVQTVLLREYLVIYGGNELALGLFFGSWLAWIAVGAAGAGRLLRRVEPDRLLVPLALVYALMPLVQTALIRGLRVLAGVPAMETFPFDRLLVVTLLSNLPVSLITGAGFTAAAALVRGRSSGSTVSRAYLLEAAGGFAGGVLATLLPWWGAGPVRILLGAGAFMALGAMAVAPRGRRGPRWVSAALAATLCVVLVTPLGAALERITRQQRLRASLPEATLVDSFDTPYRNVTLATLGTQKIVLFDGRIAQVYPAGREPVERTALMMSQAAGARDVLVLGPGSASLVRELLGYPVGSVTVVEQDEKMRSGLEGFLPEDTTRALSDPRVSVQVEDPRVWLARTDASFDLVVLAMPDPDTALLNRFYTVQFYRQVRQRLAPGGVFCTRITSAANYLGPRVRRYGRNIHHSLSSVFADVLVTPGENAVFLAARRPGLLTADPEELASRYASLGRGRGTFDPGYFSTILEPERVRFVNETLGRPPGGDEPSLMNTDDRPTAVLNHLVVMALTVDSRLPHIIDVVRTTGPWFMLVPLLAILLFRVRHAILFAGGGGPGPGNAVTYLAAAGFISISLDVVLLFTFQNRFGSLFLTVGVMNALFMGGLALGALAVRPLLRGRRSSLNVAVGVGASVALLALALPRLAGAQVGPGVFALLFLLAGLLGGAAFPAAAFLHPRSADPTGSAGSLAALMESADHWGGALGGVLAGVVMLPVLGVQDTCLVLASTAVAVLVMVAVDWPSLVPGRVLLLLRRRAARASFPWHATTSAVLVVVTASVGLGLMVRTGAARSRVSLGQDQIRSLAGEVRVTRKNRPFVHYRLGTRPMGQGADVLLSSLAVAPDVKGYGGPINLAMLVRGDGTIGTLRVLESRETPGYVKGIGRWLHASFEGRHIGRDFVLGKDSGNGDDHSVDALTGATITSRAVVTTVNRTKNQVAELMSIPVQTQPPPPVWPRYLQPSVLYMLAAFLVALVMYLWPRAARAVWPRRAMLLANLVLGGLVFDIQLSSVHLERLMRLDLPSLASAELVVLMGGAGILALLLGPLYCGSICPAGAAQELLSLAGPGIRPGPELERRARYIRYLVLAITVVVWMLSGSRAVVDADPLAHIFSGSMPTAVLLLVIASASLSIFSYRFWCRTFCPVGALLSLGGKVALALGLSPPKRYGLCDLGARADRDGECLHCNRCLSGTTLTGRKLRARRLILGRSTIDRWARLAILGVGALVVAAAISVSPDVPLVAPPSTGVPREVEMDEIHRLLESGRLSDKEALFWRSLSDDDQEEEDDDSEPFAPGEGTY